MVSPKVLLVLLPLTACDDIRIGRTPDSGPVVVHDMASGATHGCSSVGNPTTLSNLGGQHAYPQVTTNVGGYVVAWVSGIAGTTPTFRIDAQLTDATGVKQGPNLPLSSSAISASDPPSVSPIVGGTTIAWTRKAGTSTDIVITTIDQSGTKLDPTGAACDPSDVACGILPVTTSGTAHAPYLERPFIDQRVSGPTQNQLGLAFTDTRNYACSTTPCATANDVFWKLIQTNGMQLVFEKQLTATPNATFVSPRMAFDGFHQGIVWRDTTNASSEILDFAVVDNQGTLSGPPHSIGSVSGTAAPSTPDITWSGSDYGLVTASGTDATATILFQRQTANGTTSLAPKGISFGGTACTPAIAFDGTNYGVTYQLNCGTAAADVAFMLISPDGTRIATDGTSCGDSVDPACGVVRLTQNARERSMTPEVVYGGDHSFAIVWMQGPTPPDLQANTPLNVVMQRVSCN